MILISVLIGLVTVNYFIILSGKFHLHCVILKIDYNIIVQYVASYLLNAMLYMHVCGYVYMHVKRLSVQVYQTWHTCVTST